MKLADKVAFIVGGGQTPGDTIGNGRAMAMRFAREGAMVVVADRRLDSAEETVSMVKADGGKAVAQALDIRDDGQCAAAVSACVAEHGRLDILVNNVGLGTGDGGVTQITDEAWDFIYEVNVKGALHMCRHALPVMREQGGGNILNISSVAAVCAAPMVAYKSSKAALNALTHTLATGNFKYGVRANAIMPGLMKTPMAIEAITAASGTPKDDVIRARDARVPLRGGMGDAWDVANAAAFLVSDEARFITGAILPVDGGQSVRIG